MAGEPRTASAGAGIVGRLSRAVAVLAAAGCVTSSVAYADDAPVVSSEGHYSSVLLSVPEGVDATLLAGRTPAITMTTDRSVVIFGEAGEEMARVDQERIEVNEASATWRVTAESRGEPPGAGWRRLDDALFTWLEPRARPDTTTRDDQRWRVPVSVGGRRSAIRGETQWVSHTQDKPAPSRYAVVALGAAIVGLVVVQRRRRSAHSLSRRES